MLRCPSISLDNFIGNEQTLTRPHTLPRLLQDAMDKAASGMMGGFGGGRSAADRAGGPFYGGDEGDEDLLLDIADGDGWAATGNER